MEDPWAQGPTGKAPGTFTGKSIEEDPWEQGLSYTTAGRTPADPWTWGSTRAMDGAGRGRPWALGTPLFSVLAKDLIKATIGGSGSFWSLILVNWGLVGN